MSDRIKELEAKIYRARIAENQQKIIIKLAQQVIGRKNQALKKYPEYKQEIEYFIQRDPSKNLKYLAWELKILSSGQALAPEIADVVDLFHRYSTNLSNRDLNSYSPEQFIKLRDDLFQIQEKQTQRAKKVEERYRLPEACEADTVYESDSLIVRLIRNKAASVHYGLNTQWCISMKSKTYFEDYDMSNVVFFFVLRKQALNDPFDKLAIVYQRDLKNEIKQTQFFDAQDRTVSQATCSQVYGPEFEKIEQVTKTLAAKVPKSLLAKLASNEVTVDEITKAYAWCNTQEHNEGTQRILRLIAENPSTPAKVLEALAKDENVRSSIAENLSTPAVVLEALAKDKEGYVRSSVAMNPSTPAKVLEALAKDKEGYVRFSVAMNHATPAKVLEALAKDKNECTRHNVAKNPSTPAVVLETLAKDEHDYVRSSVAMNPATPAKVLEALAKDEYVRSSVAMNPSAPAKVLETLAKDENVRSSVTKNPSAPAKVLEALAKDENEHIRYNVAGHPSTPAVVLETLAKDENDFVRQNVAKNPSTPAVVLETLAKDKDKYVRYNVAMNPSTPAVVLETLAKDKEGYVRSSVARNPSTPAVV
jgi:3-methyladenine DNA glycosylase AlkC